MQAIVIPRWGDPSVFRLDELPDPDPRPGEVIVELKAAAINRRDTMVRKGTYDYPLPLIPGSDGAGIRRDTGDEVIILPSLAWGEREDAPGEDFRILGGPDDGTYAELVAVPSENVFPKPACLSWAEAAALPLVGVTAYRALFTRGGLQEGETVLILGAGSGVSTTAVSLAHQAGARVLITSSSEEKLARARELGATAGVGYTAGGWAEEILALTDGRGVDLVLDSVGTTWPDSLLCLRQGGRLVVFGATAGPTVEHLEARTVYLTQRSILGTTMGSPREFAGLLRAVEDGDWRPVIDSVRPLADATAAHERMEAGTHFGKLVLEVT